jgi:DNA-directed RNA polymerase specialized sigma24 family protein
MARSIGAPDLEQTRIISGRVSDVTQAAAVAIAEATDDLHVRIRDAMLVRREIEQTIRRIRDDRDRALIELRYIECRSYASIADEMDYSDASNARRRIWRALGRIQLPHV